MTHGQIDHFQIYLVSSAMCWGTMPIDEYAALELANGGNLSRVGSRWWRRVRPFFYRPLFPFEELVPSEVQLPVSCRIGGGQYLVPDHANANSRMKFILFQDPQSYSAGKLTQGVRYQIRKA